MDKLDGMDAYLKKLDMIQKKAPGRLIEHLDKEGRKVVSEYRKTVRQNAYENPNKQKGHLRTGMKTTFTEKKNGNYEKGIYNDSKKAPHYHLVEYGHKLVKGTRPTKGALSTQKVIGVVKPKRYFYKSFVKSIHKIEKGREKLISKLYKELM